MSRSRNSGRFDDLGGGGNDNDNEGSGVMEKLRNFMATQVSFGDTGKSVSLWIVFVILIGLMISGGVGNFFGNIFSPFGIKVLIWAIGGAITFYLAKDGLEVALYKVATLGIVGWIVIMALSTYIPQWFSQTTSSYWQIVGQEATQAGATDTSQYGTTYDPNVGGSAPDNIGTGGGRPLASDAVNEDYLKLIRLTDELHHALSQGNIVNGRQVITMIYELQPNSEVAYQAERDIRDAEGLIQKRIEELPVHFTQYTLNQGEVALALELLSGGTYVTKSGCEGPLKDWSEVAVIEDVTPNSWTKGAKYMIKCNVLTEIGSKEAGNRFYIN